MATFRNMQRLVRKLEELNIAIEDAIFPNTNSFLGENQPLADMNAFCGEIGARKYSQTDPDFSFFARAELLIARQHLKEASKLARLNMTTARTLS